MGAWNVGPFDNDAAGDALDEIEAAAPAHRLPLIRRKLSKVAGATGRLDAGDTDEALAVAALVAALVAAATGRSEALHPDAAEFLASHPIKPDAETRALALRTIDRALLPDGNEWHELWVLSNGLDEARLALRPFRDALANSLAP
ncbi:DUF4259 domain-containing protein [Spirillospora sp. CA-255316]